LGKPAGVNAHLKISSLVAGIAARGRSGLAHRAIAGFACHPDLGPLTTLVFHELVVGHPYPIERVDDRGPDVAERGASDSLVDGIAVKPCWAMVAATRLSKSTKRCSWSEAPWSKPTARKVSGPARSIASSMNFATASAGPAAAPCAPGSGCRTRPFAAAYRR